ncbi:MAG: hydantoinase/oxoprolinase N-terminal domain-containing protein [Planctomycetota bacterium]
MPRRSCGSAPRRQSTDAVCLAYGLCGRGTAGLTARDVPVVIPRVHDCISLFLGSARAYAEQFARHPGTFYFTTGWYMHKAHPERTRLAAARKFEATAHPHYGGFEARFGQENARYIVEFLESWRKNYTRAALIDHGFATAEHEETTRIVAEAAGWDYERLEGSMELLEALAAGDWDPELFLVAEPGQVIVVTNDERIFAAVPASEAHAAAASGTTAGVRTGAYRYGTNAPGGAEPDLGLGIDAGGTFTDAVLYEFSSARILSKAKAATTHRDLAEGIGVALDGLDSSLFPRVSYTCLSTTLATNAIVEGRGLPVGLVLMPYHPGMARGVKTPLFRCVRGRINIEGVAEEPPDEQEILRAAGEMVADGAAAFAVSGYGSVRNPEHELRVRDVLRQRWEVPIVCGHELSRRLNFVERAHTAVLNARLLPRMEELLTSVERVLAGAGVGGPLFVVRGDGSIVRKEVARERAVETVLSGPAASAAGGRFLTGSLEALVVDVGGTTTDIACLAEGRVALSSEGALVGRWRTSVSAIDVQTSGLGGDSAVRPRGAGAVEIGPDRVVPLCVLAAHWPEVREELAWLADARSSAPPQPEALDFFTLAGRAGGLALEPHERRIVELLRERPQSRRRLADRCECPGPRLLPVGRLERIGLVRRAGVTPTDALHVLGTYREYDAAAAEMALRVLGGSLGLGPEEAARAVKGEVERRLALALMRRELSADGAEPSTGRFEQVRPLLEKALEGEGPDPYCLRWQQLRPVVGIGAPVAAFLPGACRLLGTEPTIPPHADVANAIGAVTSQVTVRTRFRIRPGEFGTYVLYGPAGRTEFSRLEEAETAARRRVVEALRRRGRLFGAGTEEVNVEVSKRLARLSDGTAQLLEVVVDGWLSGAPTLGALR